MAKRILTSRERTLVAAAAIIFIGMVVLPLGGILAREYRATQTELSAAASRLDDARELRRVVLEQREGRKLIAKRVGAGGAGFSLYDFARSAVEKQGLKERARLEQPLASPGLDTVKIALDGVSLEELVGLMFTLQHGQPLITVDRLDYLRAANDNKGLDCVLTVQSPRL
jgi:hypothetical protein